MVSVKIKRMVPGRIGKCGCCVRVKREVCMSANSMACPGVPFILEDITLYIILVLSGGAISVYCAIWRQCGREVP